ncbi:hypothetical protein AWM75_00510 [Aerococcus urinaehominis]|uniref:Sodium/glutamate symporter n=1 Tax=Aerococcus urinaehominis TaxID=128944 RepID=A0A0X8FJP3_9LACT|nr:sodium/glutamate symporter [Aerococcus urinaehominis]AMB98564.1 hypothetical protein AWM75_00510 [Aerococcus urinaehominis]SDL77811.1 glutamate:Na+ symporter, ESS family [Aerococcus urinaehominis]
MHITLNLVQTIGLAIISLLVGKWLTSNISKLEEYSLPPAIVGGLAFALVNMVLRLTGLVTIELDTSLTMFFMVIYFTTIGFDASLKALSRAKQVVGRFLLLAVLAIFVQNILALILSKFFNIPGPVALLLGSPALVGGPGTAAAVSPSIAELGYTNASSVGVIAATLGIVLGSISGGPVAAAAVKKYDLSAANDRSSAMTMGNHPRQGRKKPLTGQRIALMVYLIFLVIFAGSYLTQIINASVSHFVDGISFPVYIGPMIVAAVVRNISDARPDPIVDDQAVAVTSDISLNLFLSLTMISLELWTIIDMALPMMAIIALEALATILFARFIVFKVMGQNYDAAVMTAGFLGFGMGSSSNAMACMRQITHEYGPSPLAFLAVSIVGTLFIDFINIFVIYGFIQWAA